MHSRNRLHLLLMFVLGACGQRGQSDRRVDTSTARDSAETVSLSGIGPIVAGMPYRSLLASVGAPPPTDTARAAECRFTGIPEKSAWRGVSVMIVRDTVARVDIDSGSIATMWGDRIGDSEEQVIARHSGRIRVEPHKYTGPVGHYLIVADSTDTLHRLIFETDGKHVLRYRAGRRPEVEWVERCS